MQEVEKRLEQFPRAAIAGEGIKNFSNLFNPFLHPFRLQQHHDHYGNRNMLRKPLHLLLTGLLVCSTAVEAKIDLVTLPARDKTQLTIYNSADLTLVREQRTLTLKKGLNRLEFGWENTLIDPTSVQLYAPVMKAGYVYWKSISRPISLAVQYGVLSRILTDLLLSRSLSLLPD